MGDYNKPLVASNKKVKILLIEDDERQINYARQVLVGHSLTVMRAWKKLDDPSSLFRQFDLIITDLVLPKEQADGSKSAPRWNVGLGIYWQALRSLRQGEVKGVALVSDFEHHVSAEGTWDVEEMRERILHAIPLSVHVGIGKQIEWDIELSKTRVVSTANYLMNYLAVFDRVIWRMPQFLDQEGQIRMASEIPKDKSILKHVKEQGWSILKPYKEVVDALLMDLN